MARCFTFIIILIRIFSNLHIFQVTEGGLAEKAGLKVGDVIVRINDDSTSCMTHNDAHDIIMRAGNNFFFGVIR